MKIDPSAGGVVDDHLLWPEPVQLEWQALTAPSHVDFELLEKGEKPRTVESKLTKHHGRDRRGLNPREKNQGR